MQGESIVFSFLDPIEYLNFQFRTRQRKDPKFTLRKWALQLGYQNPSYLSHILKRERKLKIDVAAKIAETFHLNSKERSYFELIVLRSNSDSEIEKDLYGKLIRKIRPKQFWDMDELPMEKFELASEWYNWAILELVCLKDFFPNVDYIQARLGTSVTKKMIKDSLARLTDLGFLVNTADGGFRRGTDNALYLKNIPSSYKKEYHKTMLDRAKLSVDKPIDERHVRGTMVALDRKKFDEAQKILEDTHRKLLELSAEDDGDDVFYFGSTLFPVTEKQTETLH